MNVAIVVTAIGLCTSVAGFVLSFMAFKKNEKLRHKDEGQGEGVILSDIGHIKSTVDRMDKNLTSVDERYRNIAERMARVEESLSNVQVRVSELTKIKGD